LNYDAFIAGSCSEQLTEYLRPLPEACRHLAAFGASAAQMDEFDQIIAAVAESVAAADYRPSLQ